MLSLIFVSLCIVPPQKKTKVASNKKSDTKAIATKRQAMAVAEMPINDVNVEGAQVVRVLEAVKEGKEV